MPNSKPVQRFGNSRQQNGASLQGGGLEWGQEGAGTEGRQDKGDIKDAKPESPVRSDRVDTKYPS